MGGPVALERGRDVVGRIAKFNAGREPQRLRLKYDLLQGSAFRFFRGTCHLFYEDWPTRSPLDRAPHTWISGDLNPENFGAYKGDDRIIYFDINDFDEAALAPCTWELARFTTAVLLAADGSLSLCRTFLDAYAQSLARGKARQVERLVADGSVRRLLESVLHRSRRELLDRRTVRRSGRRGLRLGKRALPVTPDERRAVAALLRQFARKERRPQFFRVLDVARRVAGAGSLGVQRFVVLVEGKGSPDHNYLLDLKEARPSALSPYLPCPQPRWTSEAHRVVTIQDRMQAVAPALLHAVTLGGRSFVLKELQPTEDRLGLGGSGAKGGKLERVIRTMGRVTAWSQLRSAGRQGSAIADDLVSFAGKSGWQAEVLRYAQAYARQVRADWKAFRKAADRGAVALPG